MTKLFRNLAVASLLLGAGAASAMPIEASRYDDTTYPDLDVTWFSGTTAGGAGLEHDDAVYPEKLELWGGAAPAFAPVSPHDDVVYPEELGLVAQVGTEAPERPGRGSAGEIIAHAGGSTASGSP